MKKKLIQNRHSRTHLDTSFCTDVGQVKPGMGKRDTYRKMLQEITRVTPGISAAIAREYPDVRRLIGALERGGEDALVGLEVCLPLLGCERRGVLINWGDRIRILATHCRAPGLSARLVVRGLREYFWGGIHGELMFSGFPFFVFGVHVDGVLELGLEGVVGDSNTIILIGLYLASLKTFAPY